MSVSTARLRPFASRSLVLLVALLLPALAGCKAKTSSAPAVASPESKAGADAVATLADSEEDAGEAPDDSVEAEDELEALLAGDDIEALEAALAERRGLLGERDADKDTSGVRTDAGGGEEAEAGAGAGPTAGDAGLSGPRCTQVCELQDAICKIKGRVCELAEKHDGETRYANVCARAQEDCTLASTACERCSG